MSQKCNFHRFSVCFQPCINIACRITQNDERIKRFLRLHILIKPLLKMELNKYSITLKRNSFKISSQIWRLSKVRTSWPYRWFWKFFELFHYKSTRASMVLNIEWMQFVLKTCEILHFLEVCMIKTAPHSALSPQMWCRKKKKTKKAKGWFPRTQIYWQEFVK